MKTADGAWRGISIELWEDVARRLELDYELHEAGLAEMIDEVAEGGADLAVAALTVTPERERRVDFSHPFYSSGLGIAVAAGGGAGWTRTARAFASLAFVQAVAALAAVLLVAGALVWFFERRANPDQFGGGRAKGLGSGFWWAAVTMTTVGYGDKAPQTAGGRVVALIWMFASLIVVSGFTATIASSLTVNSLAARIGGPEDLPDVRVATVADTSAATWLDDRGIATISLADPGEAIEALAADRVDAVVYDAPILEYMVGERADADLVVLPHRLTREHYAFALPAGGALRERLNRALLEAVAGERGRALFRRYLGVEE